MRTVPALKFALLLALGIFIGDWVPSVFLTLVVMASLLLILLGFISRNRNWSNAPVCIAAIFTGMLLGMFSSQQLGLNSEGDRCVSGKVISQVFSGDDRQVSLFRPERLYPPLIKGDRGDFNGDLRLITSPDTRLIPGAKLWLRGELHSYSDQRNPGGRDWQKEFLRRGIVGWVKPDTLIVTQLGNLGWAPLMRERLSGILALSLPKRQARLASSMILGDRSLLPDTLDDDFRRSGLYHLLVVSGSNIACLTGILALIIGPFSLSLRTRRLVIIAGIWLYVLITGLEPPALRAALMITVVLLSYDIRRVPRPWNGLGVAALILLILDPQQLFQPGFQLSFAAMAGVLFALDIHARRELSRPVLPAKSRRLSRFMNRWIVLGFHTSLCAIMFTAPILTAHFGGYAPAGVFWNLLAVPLTGVIFNLSWLIILLRGLLGLSPEWFNSALELALKAMESLASWGAALPGNATGQYGGELVALLLAVALVGFFLLRRNQRRLIWVAGAVAVFLLLPLGHAATMFEIEFFDVGQGEATLMRFPDGQNLLVDTGDAESARFELLPALKRQGITRLSGLVISHFDRDHCGGAIAVMNALRVDRLLINESEPEDDLGRSILKAATAKRIPVRVLSLGDTLAGLPGTRALVLWPSETLKTDDDNRQSLVLRVSYGQVDVLFMGDLAARDEKALLAAGSYLQSEILKVAHHGSVKSSSRAFLEMVKPQFALIGVGKNRYGHPSARVLKDLEALGIQVHRTDWEGAGIWRSDGKTVWEVLWR
jgi:competence protein ComEC